MQREATSKEQSILNLFKDKIQLNQTKDCSNVTLNIKKQKLIVPQPLIYELEGTDSILILGTPKQTINIEILKKIYEEQLKKQMVEVKESNELDPKSKEEAIRLVQSQLGVDREKIVESLTENGFDVVKTILDLSK